MKVWTLMVALLAGCRSETALPLTVEYSGCTSVLAGPVCEVEAETRLNFWLADPPADSPPVPVELRLNGTVLTPEEVVPVGGGVRHKVAVRPGVLTLQRGLARWSLLLGPDSRPPLITEVDALRRHDPATALARLDAAQTEDAVSRGQIELLQGKVLRQMGRVDEALAALKAAEESLGRAGHWSGSTNAAEVAAFILTDGLYRFADAEDVLRGHPRGGDAWPEGKARVAVYQAEIFCGALEPRRCLHMLDEADVLVERLDMRHFRLSSSTRRAYMLDYLGDHAAAITVAKEVVQLTKGGSACDEMTSWNNVAVILTGLGDTPAAHSAASEATRLAKGCQVVGQRLAVSLSTAQIFLDDGRVEQAEEILRSLPADMPSRRLGLWLQVQNGQASLLHQRWDEARMAFREAVVLSSATNARELAHLALLGEATSLAGMGRTEEALLAFHAADQTVTETFGEIPLDGRRDVFAGHRDQGVRSHLGLLVSLGRGAEALTISRRSQSRSLTSLQLADRIDRLDEAHRRRWQEAIGAYRLAKAELDADDWSASAEERARREAARPAGEARLRRLLDEVWAVVGAPTWVGEVPLPGPGELVLHYREGLKGWWGFAATRAGVTVVELAAPPLAGPPEMLARHLFNPFADAIRTAQRIRLVVAGPLAAVDLHALPFEGAPLWERRLVVYGLDVPGAAREPGTGALVVADPRGDLAGARRSGEAAAGALQARLLRGDEAGREAVLAALSQADLFVYAGHGALAGDGWASHLRLAGEDRLLPGDVLLQPRVPRRVVLAGCETGRVPERTLSTGMSLTHAFVVAGAEAVVATTRPVADEQAARLLDLLHAELVGNDDLARALHRALARTEPSSDRAAWRVVVR